MSEVKISIIVPVYNAENYLCKCIESILNQTEKSIELILVNDGSVDSSGSICDEYAKLDSRVTVIHQKNAGVSEARNAGVKVAQGDFIGFVDSDDWILPEMYSDMLKYAELYDSEIVMCDITTVYSDGRTELDTISQLSDSLSLEKKDLAPKLLLEMAGSSCRCLYNNKLLLEHNIEFPVNVKFSEDRIFNLYVMGNTNKIYYQKKSYYMRLINSKSAVHSFHEDYFERIKNSFNYTKVAIKDAWNDDEMYQEAYLSQFIGGAIAAINNYFYKTSHFSWREKQQAVKSLCNDIELRNAIEKTQYGGIRGKWILNNNVFLLCLCAMILNLKYGR